jgi:hypothetical protein
MGTSAGAEVFCCSAMPEEVIPVLTGHDDQTWKIGLIVSTSCLQEMLLELHKIAIRERGA